MRYRLLEGNVDQKHAVSKVTLKCLTNYDLLLEISKVYERLDANWVQTYNEEVWIVISEVKQSQICDARLCTSNHEKTS